MKKVKKDNRIELRLSSNDKNQIKELAQKNRLTVSAFLLNMVSTQLN